MSDSDTLLQLSSLPPGIRDLRDDELAWVKTLWQSDYYLPHLVPNPEGSWENGTRHLATNCVTCGGKGTFRSWAETDEGDTITATYQCRCLDQWQLFMAFLHSNILIRYQRLGWHDVEVAPKDQAPVLNYLAGLEHHVRGGQGLILQGERGTGKTLLAMLTLKYAIGGGYEGYFTTFNNLLDTYTEGWKDRDKAVYFHSRIKNAEILVIDDVGKENENRGEVVRSAFDEVIRHRVGSAKPTIITSEWTTEKIALKYGGSLRSLLEESVVSHWFDGSDYRPQYYRRLDQEAELGISRHITVGGNPLGRTE